MYRTDPSAWSWVQALYMSIDVNDNPQLVRIGRDAEIKTSSITHKDTEAQRGEQSGQSHTATGLSASA